VLGFSSHDGTGARGVFNYLHDITVYTMILVSAALLPGYLASFLVIDSWGRKPIQLMGFAALSILFLTMGASQRLSFYSDCLTLLRF
jgi:MFS transporter, PHS family, inorganic phosphate transporter